MCTSLAELAGGRKDGIGQSVGGPVGELAQGGGGSRIQLLGQILTSVPSPGSSDSATWSCATDFGNETPHSLIRATVHYLGEIYPGEVE